MLENRPTLWPIFWISTGIILCGATWQQVIPNVPDWIAVVALYGLIALVILWFLAAISYTIHDAIYARYMWKLGQPQVRITEAYVDLARQVRDMSVLERDLFRQTINTLQFPTSYEPEDVINIAGRDVQVSSIMDYISKMAPDGTMPPVRNYTKEPERSDIRHLAQHIEKDYAVEASSNRSSVKTNKQKLHEMIEAA